MRNEVVRINNKGREDLKKLKRVTGIETYNIICRWALCRSLQEKTPPPPIDQRADKGLEMTWRTFGGKNEDVYEGLIKLWCLENKESLEQKNLNEQLKRHIHRGLGYLAGNKKLMAIEDFFQG